MTATAAPHDATFFIALNAGSGHSETDERRSTIETVMRDAGRRFELTMIDQPDTIDEIATRLAKQAADSGGVLVAAGGDGTINAVARQAVAHGCKFGVLPQGTFNYFGRTHGIPEDLTEAVHALLASRVHAVQVGVINDRVFLVNASIGLYPNMLEAREADKQQFGRSRLVAVFSAFKTLLRPHRRLRLALNIDGKPRHLRTATFFVGNNRLQMEQIGIPPLSDALEDGRLAAVAPRTKGKFGMLWLMLHGALGRMGRLNQADELTTFSFKRVEVKVRSLSRRRQVKVATDGEITMMSNPLEIHVMDEQLLLLKPDPKPADVD
ncbi:diacylglycerol/lipid kinase family protein [Duganella phyllosphaerae]|uniref:Putative lipid kinase BmrU n=1 Tax=Duganella phyllosphaerae TaxID=762836 RepID=A0A1E7WEP4_9BURK|nr:diacylglycerol kinase family protein [Duganella phyllosphaerae]OEZ96763.1 putative lipid kinase BmrU [Duganella phyllosphaerae]